MAMAHRSSIAGIIMAAGLSRRFGGNKLLVPLAGKPLIVWTVEAALASRLNRVVVVLGHDHAAVGATIAGLVAAGRVTTVVNEAYREGQSRSVIAGLDAVRGRCSGAMFLVADQPLLTAGIIDALIAAHVRKATGICLPTHDGERRNPVIFAERFFPDILALTGDLGARAVIDAHPEAVTAVAFADDTPFRDIDRPKDLQAVGAGLSRKD